jgi:hypothetical protein
MLIVITLMVLMAASVAFAADASPTDIVETPKDYVSWEFLGTSVGAVAATTIIVQFLKLPIDSVWKVKTRYIVYLIALIILLGVEYVSQGGILFNRLFLIAINAILVATASMGAYEQTIKYLEKPG